MLHAEVIIITYSDILSQGLAEIISEIKDIRVDVSIYPPDEISKIGEHLSDGNVVIMADCSCVAVEKIDALRNDAEAKLTIIGVYMSALPASVSTHYDTLLSVYANQNSIIQTVTQTLRDVIATKSDSQTDELTPREKEIVIGVVKGLSNKEIAAMLKVSVHTVTTHRRNIASKLQIHSPSALTIYAIVSKLVSIEDIKSEFHKKS